LLESFIDRHLHHMDGDALQEYQVIISENDVDLFNWISGVKPIPEKYKTSKVLAHLYDFCQERKTFRSHTCNNLN
jgi:succinate dehydrogenase flavin-adding protein (antitoxin of CptAB toxin-antitoxin module)